MPQGEPHDAPTKQLRLVWVDVAKGIGIILVVYGHALRGFWGQKPWPLWTVIQDRLIYSFHMPLFFVIAGLFLWSSIRRGRGQFIKGRWWAITYPYLLWSIVCGGIELAASRFANTPMTWRDLLLIPVAPIEQFWFLYALLLVQLLAAVCYPSKAALVAATVIGLTIVSFSGTGTIFQTALRFLPFLTVGVCGSALICQLALCRSLVKLLIFVAAWSVFGLIHFLSPSGPWSLFALACAGAVGCLTGAMLLAGFRVGAALAVLGQASIAIFVLHTLCSAGVRAGFVMLQFDRYALWTLVPETIAGLLLPVPVWWWSRSQRFGSLLGFGAVKSKRMASEEMPSAVEPLGA